MINVSNVRAELEKLDHKSLVAYALKLEHDLDTADDLVGEAYKDALVYCDKGGTIGELAPFVKKAMYNLRNEELRNRKRRQEKDADVVRFATPGDWNTKMDEIRQTQRELERDW